MHRDAALLPESPLPDLVTRQLGVPSTSWSIGVLGALAEFHRDPDEGEISTDGANRIVTGRGALRIDLSIAARPIAYETVTASAESWNHGVALCLPRDACAMHRRRVITELGPDREAIRAQDRTAILFDLGLDTPYCDFHVRSANPQLIARLRAAAGMSLFDTRHDVLHDIPLASPHRVFASRLGRIEVYQHIGTSETPEGPHTHLLPKLLRSRRTHSANVALPAGWVPCVTLYPANPVRDDRGMPKPFDAAQHHAFQALLEAYGEPDVVNVKRTVCNAVRKGAAPDALGNLSARRHRMACRVALRQMRHTDGITPALAAWRAAFEPAVRSSRID